MPCMFLGNQLKYEVTSAVKVERKVAMRFPQGDTNQHAVTTRYLAGNGET